MNWAWATSLDNFWRSPTFPMWLTLAAAGFFGILVLITLVRAEKSVATGALTVITLLAVGVAVAATIRGYGAPAGRIAGSETPPAVMAGAAALPSLSCLDDLAGDLVLAACEKEVFASPQSTAAAVSYVASQISRLTALGDAATAAHGMTPEMQAVRRSIEHDRYGLVAHVLQVRDNCTPTDCSVFRSLTDNHQIITNMDEHRYDGLVDRYVARWNAPATTAALGAAAVPGMGALAAFPPSVPTGKPTNADFPSAASTPPVSIMEPEPGTGTPGPGHARSSPGTPSAPRSAVAATKKPKPKPSHAPPPPERSVGGPTLLSPTPSAPAGSKD